MALSSRPRREPRFLAPVFFRCRPMFRPAQHGVQVEAPDGPKVVLRATGEDEEAWQQAYQMELQRKSTAEGTAEDGRGRAGNLLFELFNDVLDPIVH